MIKLTFLNLTPEQKNRQLLMYLSVLKTAQVKRSTIFNGKEVGNIKLLKLALGLFGVGDKVICSVIPGDYTATVVATGYETLRSGGFKCGITIRYGNREAIDGIAIEHLRFV